MELTPRKQAVLKAVVKAYIETGEPIGSKILAGLLENAPSSATLRNEMSDLCELGLLKQPHTSAGRVPTVGGLRFYIDSLMSESDISDRAKKMINSALDSAHCEPEHIPEVAARALARLTGLPAVSCLISQKPPVIKRLELFNVGRSSVMLLVITDDGRTRSRIFRHSGDFTFGIKKLFSQICGRYMLGRSVDELNPGYIQSIAATAGTWAFELIPLLTAVCDTVSNIGCRSVRLQNEGALYDVCDGAAASLIKNMVSSEEPMISVLEKAGNADGVIFGADTGYDELKYNTIVASGFSVADKYRGYVGIIGPNRMSYEQILPGTLYTAQRLGEVMNEAQKDMED